MTTDRVRATRRDFLLGASSLTAMSTFGCKGSGELDVDTDDSSGTATGETEISAKLWQTMSPLMRAADDGSYGSRINIYNSSDGRQRILIQVFAPSGLLVASEEIPEMPENTSEHIEFADLLARHDVHMPFEGAVWVGARPLDGEIFLGLQGIVFDWYGPSHMASVHGMRDFGNSNADSMWTDLVLPKVVNTDRYVTWLALVNASGDGVSEAYDANPELIIRDDDGNSIVQMTLDVLPPYTSKVVAVDELPGGDQIGIGSLQIREPAAGLVVYAFLVDRDNGGFVSADHLFDRHFVVHGIGFG